MQGIRRVRYTAFVLAVLSGAVAWADAPRLIAYQGRLAGAGNGPVDLEISVHKDPALFSPQFTELHTGVPLSDGVFSVLIGSQTPGGVPEAVYNQTGRWVGVAVDGGAELLPRTQFTLVPFAARALHADGLLAPGNSLRVAVAVGSAGDVTMFDSSGDPQFDFDLNGSGSAGVLRMYAADHATENVRLEAAGVTGGAALTLLDASGSPAIFADAGAGGFTLSSAGIPVAILEADSPGTPQSRLSLYDAAGVTRLVDIQGAETSSTGAQVFLRDADGTVTFDLDAEFNANGGAQLDLRTGNGVRTILLDAQSVEGGAAVILEDAVGTPRIQLNADDPAEGLMTAFADAGNPVFRLKSDQSGDNGEIDLVNQNGITAVEAIAFAGSTGGRIILREGVTGEQRVRIHADNGTRNATIEMTDGGSTVLRMKGEGGGAVELLDAGLPVLQLLADDGAGDSRVVTDVIQINGGSDLSERFDIAGAVVEAGMVVRIDAARPGRLAVCDAAYDTRVAGVVSGAGGVRPGMLMGQRGTLADGEHPVALSGRVWTLCDADDAPIRPGDLLTTATVPGHAMRASDAERRGGAIIGKAMTGLERGRGLVLVLVSLQ